MSTAIHPSIQTDKEHVLQMLADGDIVYDGGQNTVPELALPSIHQVKGLRHLGFGNFATDEHTFLRADSPKGTRFYMRVSN